MAKKKKKIGKGSSYGSPLRKISMARTNRLRQLSAPDAMAYPSKEMQKFTYQEGIAKAQNDQMPKTICST